MEENEKQLKERPFVTHYPGEQLQLEMRKWIDWKVGEESIRLSDNARYSQCEQTLVELDQFAQLLE